MAEMRPAGLTEDGTALRLTDQDGGEHTLPLTDEVRSLVAGDSGSDSPAADDDRAASAEDAGEGRERSDQDRDASSAADSSSASPEDSSGTTTAPSSASSETAASGGSRDAAARAAVGLPRFGASTRPGADAADEVPAQQVSPREIQTRIRAGATAEEVVEATGASLARVRIFEYPVLAERAWIAQQVQQLEVWVGGPDLYSSTVEDGGPSTLGELVSHRLQELGLDADAVRWDAWREGPGPWTVVADFGIEGLRSKPTQEQPPARFAFRQGAKHVDHVNRWAQLLADAETWNISGGGKDDETPFDVEAGDGPERPAAEPTALRPDAAPDPDEELLDILRARRGQRLGADEESDDALALMLTRDETPTPQQPVKPTLAAADDTGAGSAPSAADQTEYLWDDEDGGQDGPLASVHAFRTADAERGAADDAGRAGSRDEDTAEDAPAPDDAPAADADHDHDVAGPDAAEAADPSPTGPSADRESQDDRSPAASGTRADAPATHEADDVQDADADSEDADSAAPGRPQPTAGRGTSRGRIADVLIKDTSAQKPGAEKKTTRSKSTNRRASVPSWDEIVFGRKND